MINFIGIKSFNLDFSKKFKLGQINQINILGEKNYGWSSAKNKKKYIYMHDELIHEFKKNCLKLDINKKVIENGKITINVQVKQPFGNKTRFHTDRTIVNCVFPISKSDQYADLIMLRLKHNLITSIITKFFNLFNIQEYLKHLEFKTNFFKKIIYKENSLNFFNGQFLHSVPKSDHKRIVLLINLKK
jgi:hypothetical protein